VFRGDVAEKASHLNTANLCAQQVIRFVPLVAESSGGWDREAGHILLQISRSAATRTGEDAGVLHGNLFKGCRPCRRPRAFREAGGVTSCSNVGDSAQTWRTCSWRSGAGGMPATLDASLTIVELDCKSKS
jgi:hypothetical protein